MSWLHTNTARKVRELARKAGHDLTRFDVGDFTAIASCKNEGCTVMVEIRGKDEWRFIRLGEPEESCAAERPWVHTSENDTPPVLRYQRTTTATATDGASVLADHLKNCAKVDAAIVMHGPGESADDVIAELLASGWTWDEERPGEVVAGKRIRYLRAPGEEES